jgi:ribose 5-phosphate isomerase B
VRVYLGSDHAGFELKAAIVTWLGEAGHEAVDCGPASYDPQDDYPVYVLRAAQGAVRDPGSLGIVIGGSGNGEQIAANKVPGVRAALAWTVETAQLARQHNDANVLSLGARMYSLEDALSFAKVFVATPFSGEARHARRLAMIAEFEKTGELPDLLCGGATRAIASSGPLPPLGLRLGPAPAAAPGRGRRRGDGRDGLCRWG